MITRIMTRIVRNMKKIPKKKVEILKRKNNATINIKRRNMNNG